MFLRSTHALVAMLDCTLQLLAVLVAQPIDICRWLRFKCSLQVHWAES
jgi:hypothetical protein